MALGNVIFLGGFEGSNLDRAAATLIPSTRYWLTFPPFFADRWPFLELQPDGVTPALNFAGNIVAAGLVPLFYSPIITRLERDWTVYPIAYDWRKSITVTGPEVYNQIQALIPNEDYYLVGHSMGGLIARMVWRQAGIAGTQSRIKRVLTLGSPHWGSYAAVDAWTRRSETYRLLVIASGAVILPPFERFFDTLAGIPYDFLDRVLASLPGLYEQMPNPLAPSAAGDPARLQLFNVATWLPINFRVSSVRLGTALTTMALLADATTQPPDSKLVCVVGRGINTADRANQPLQPSGLSPWSYDDGDGTVGRRDARLREAAWEVFCSHTDLVKHNIVLNSLTILLTEGLAPAPPIVENPGRFTIPGPEQPAGPLTTQQPPFGEIFDFGDIPQRPPTRSEPRPSYCP